MEDQPLHRSKRFQNLPPSVTVEPPLPPKRMELDTKGSFEPVYVSEVLGELKLRIKREETSTVEIEYLQADNFAINFNLPQTDLNNPVIV